MRACVRVCVCVCVAVRVAAMMIHLLFGPQINTRVAVVLCQDGLCQIKLSI